MHREPKKPKNPLFPDNEQENAPKADEALKVEQSAEGRIVSYWENNKSSIIGAIIISAIFIIGVQGYKIAEQKAELKIQNDYEVAKLDDSLESFVGTHSDTLLGGFAALELANKSYEAKDYSVALEFYTTAKKGLATSFLKDKACIGIAFARYQIDQEEGLSALEAVFTDFSIMESVRAEAGYVLLIDAQNKGDEAKAKSFAETINTFENAGSWKFRISQFL